MAKLPRGGMTEMMKSAADWQRAAMAWNAMTLSASEVIWRRSVMMALGTMSPAEAARMVLEKPAAFAKAAERAAVSAAGSRGAAATAGAAIKPIGARTRANAKRLSRSRR